jgi:hypothetical protein
MPITQVDINDAEKLLDELLGNEEAAREYSKAPEQWLTEHGYANVSPEAVAQCGASGGYAGGAAGGGAVASASASASAGVAGVAAQLNPIVYNTYYEDNSITNNLQADGNIAFDQTVQQVEGDGNVLQDDVNVGGDQQIQTGSGIQAGGDVDIDDSNVATGDDNQQAIDESINVDGGLGIRVPLLREGEAEEVEAD